MAALLALRFSARAKLEWTQKELTLKLAPAQDKVSAKFDFVNSGTYPVEISNVTTTCGCTTAALDKKEYGAGDHGEVSVIYTAGDRVGAEERSIIVTTNDESDPLTVLKLTVIVPELLRIRPTFLFWKPYEELNPKEAAITIPPDSPVKHISVTSRSKNVIAEIRPGATASQFVLVVTPHPADSQLLNAMVEVETDYPKDQPKVFIVYVRMN